MNNADAQEVLSVNRLLEVVDVLQHMSEAFGELKPSSQKTLLAQHQATIACLLVMELAHHLRSGMDIRGALKATARGEMKIG